MVTVLLFEVLCVFFVDLCVIINKELITEKHKEVTKSHKNIPNIIINNDYYNKSLSCG